MSTPHTQAAKDTLKGLWIWARLLWRQSPIGVCGAFLMVAICGAASTLANFAASSHRAEIQNILIVAPVMFAALQWLIGLLISASVVAALRHTGLRLAPGLQRSAFLWMALCFVVSWAIALGPLAWAATRHAMGWALVWSLGLSGAAWAASLRMLISPVWWRWFGVWLPTPIFAFWGLNALNHLGLLDNVPDWLLNFLAADASYWLTNKTWASNVLPPGLLPWVLAGLGAWGWCWAWRECRAELQALSAPARRAELQQPLLSQLLPRLQSTGPQPTPPQRGSLHALVLPRPPSSLWALNAVLFMMFVTMFGLAVMVRPKGQASPGASSLIWLSAMAPQFLALAPSAQQARLSQRGLLVPGGLARQTSAVTLTWQLLGLGAPLGAAAAAVGITAFVLGLGLPLHIAPPLVLSICALQVLLCATSVALLPLLAAAGVVARAASHIGVTLLLAALMIASQVLAIGWLNPLSPLSSLAFWATAEFLWAIALLLLWLLPRLSARAWARHDWARWTQP